MDSINPNNESENSNSNSENDIRNRTNSITSTEYNDPYERSNSEAIEDFFKDSPLKYIDIYL